MSNGFNYQTRTSEDCLYLNIWTPEVDFYNAFKRNIILIYVLIRRDDVTETYQFYALLLVKKWLLTGQGIVQMVLI